MLLLCLVLGVLLFGSGLVFRSPPEERQGQQFSAGGFVLTALVLSAIGLWLLSISHNVTIGQLLGEVLR